MSVYLRPDGAYVAPSDQTTEGVWIGNGEVEFVSKPDPGQLGRAIVRGLQRSHIDVAHPRRDEWTQQRRKSLDPITKLAGVRSSRALIRVADVVDVMSNRSTVTIEPYQRVNRYRSE